MVGTRMFAYPGGAQAPQRPSDGQIHILWDNFGNPEFTYQWDDLLSQWVDVTAGKNPIKLRGNAHIKINKCECGSEKSGSNRHSSWCPKHTSES